jgi:molybdopterin converting factor small subunit
MAIQVRVAGVFGGAPLNEAFEEPFKENDTAKKILSRLDKKKVLGRKFFGGMIKRGRATLLLNGERLDSPEALNRRVSDGDEISVISAIAGG